MSVCSFTCCNLHLNLINTTAIINARALAIDGTMWTGVSVAALCAGQVAKSLSLKRIDYFKKRYMEKRISG
jgi:hypothetical protein